MPTLDLYFDFVSPFAYLAWMRLKKRAWDVRPHPVVFGALLDAWGHKGPAEIPSKRAFTWKTCLRAAARENIPFRFPATHPFNPLTALRAALLEPAVIDPLFRAAWQDGRDLSQPETLVAIFGNELVQATQEQAVKDRLRAATEAAVQRGVFGVPTLFLGDELFWGNDQLEVIEDVLAGRDPLDRTALAAALATPVGVQRKVKS